MSSGTILLGWMLGFWPMLAITEAYWKRKVSSEGLFTADASAVFVMFLVYLAFAIWFSRGYFQSRQNSPASAEIDDADDDEIEEPEEPTLEDDCDNNVLIIVEAPDLRLFERAGAASLEASSYFERIPEKNTLLVLNGDNEEDSDICGFVDEAAEAVHVFKDNTTWRVWVILKNPDDYVRLAERPGWNRSTSKNCRTTSLSHAFTSKPTYA